MFEVFSGPLLAIETSCDETSAAVLDGRRVLANIVSSQVELHQKWGGIVPEAAARAHVESILPVIEEALTTAKIGSEDIRAVAATNRPGLVGALSVGLTAAKAISFALGVPLIGVHHLEGHLMSPFLQTASSNVVPLFPHLALIVSGGHTELVKVDGFDDYHLVGETLDDAAGEAFDKASRLLGLGYPGGQRIQEAAADGNPHRYALPRGLSDEPNNFSFSGLKTAVLRLVEREGSSLSIADAAASVQEAIVSVLADKAIRAAEDSGAKALTLVGGVAANRSLRERLAAQAHRIGLTFLTPAPEFCTDNAAMIGLAGSARLARREQDTLDLDVASGAPLPGRATASQAPA